MIRIILFGLLLIGCSNISLGADNYKTSDTLFVWASNGLHLRSKPNTNSTILTTLKFGQNVAILEKTDFKFNVSSNSEPWIDNTNNKIDPIILYGNWVKVSVDSNLVGYVIDQYLLAIEPNGNKNEWVLKPINADTISTLKDLPDGSHSDLVIKKTYNREITGIETTGENWGGTVYRFPGFTIEEVLVFFFFSKQEPTKYLIETNNKDEIIFTDHSCIEITIRHIGDDTTVDILGGC